MARIYFSSYICVRVFKSKTQYTYTFKRKQYRKLQTTSNTFFTGGFYICVIKQLTIWYVYLIIYVHIYTTHTSVHTVMFPSMRHAHETSSASQGEQAQFNLSAFLCLVQSDYFPLLGRQQLLLQLNPSHSNQGSWPFRKALHSGLQPTVKKSAFPVDLPSNTEALPGGI